MARRKDVVGMKAVATADSHWWQFGCQVEEQGLGSAQQTRSRHTRFHAECLDNSFIDIIMHTNTGVMWCE